jgi:hypothetical protein
LLSGRTTITEATGEWLGFDASYGPERSPEMNQFDRLLNGIHKLSQSLSAFVSHYGVAEAIAFNARGPAVAIDDFFHYCLAKGSKHIRAALVLLDHDLPEDAIVLSRAAYECYVSAAYAKTQGVQAIDDLVYNPVGRRAGTVEYARTKAGRPDYRRLVDKETGTFYDAPPSIERMIGNTGYAADALVHRQYYGFSSEHAHVNMSGAGNYREGARYTDCGKKQKPNGVFLTAYVTVTLLGIAIATTDVDKMERSRIKRELRAAIKQINGVLAKHFENPADDFVRAVGVRLDQVVG